MGERSGPFWDGVEGRAPMPPAESGPDPSDLLGLLHLVRSREPKLVVALGAGPATVWLAYALESAGRLVIVEQDVVPDAQGRLVPDPADSARRSRTYLREKVGL